MSHRSLYIASGLGNAVRVGRLRDRFHGLLVGLTYDWTLCGQVCDPEAAAALAHHQSEGVARARCLLLLMPGGRGTHFELGMAHALRVPVVALNDVGAPWDVTFHHLPGLLKCNCEEDAVNAVLEILRRQHHAAQHMETIR